MCFFLRAIERSSSSARARMWVHSFNEGRLGRLHPLEAVRDQGRAGGRVPISREEYERGAAAEHEQFR